MVPQCLRPMPESKKGPQGPFFYYNEDIMKRGSFIVIEGADGVGSTTQAKLLVEYLNKAGTQAIFTAEPSGGEIGALARRMLRGDSNQKPETLALLFAADRLQHYYSEIAPVLERGITVVSDRYILSSLVYQSLDIPTDWGRQINSFAPTPDTTALITVPFETAWSRIHTRIAAGSTEEIFDKMDLQQRIHALYEQLLLDVNGYMVDGSGTPEEVLNLLIKAVAPHIAAI